MSADRPTRLLIAALGGEGGGVLAGWIVNAAVASGATAQRTSIPGVAQRTGATTYYIEIIPEARDARPILALNPAPGEVDVMLATELLEAGRCIQAGFVTPDRTFLIASSHRVYTVAEKAAMGDGRFDRDRLLEAARRFSRASLVADLAAAASAAGSAVNAVMLGALAASGALPVPIEAFRAAIRDEGKAVAANLDGFEAGMRIAQSGEGAPEGQAPRTESGGAAALEAAAQRLPADAAPVAAEGVRRLVDYQDADHARLYLARLDRFAGKAGADGMFLRELARHLALRMSVEDTIRVAELKLRESRLARIRAEARAAPGDIVQVTEFMKPGPEEILSLAPPGLARPLLAFVERRGWMGLAVPLKVRTTGVWGFLRLKALAALRRWRRRSLRFAEEEAWIERWLTLVERALATDPQAAREIVETARLVKGYGETCNRGRAAWSTIADEVIEPMLQGRLPARHFADAVLQARLAALADPEGGRLAEVVAGIRKLAQG